MRLYSATSFLYRLLTASQRNKDTSKNHGLGPFSYLLSRHLYHRKTGGEQLLYRGVTLTDEIIEEYKRVLGQWIVWPSHVSASKKRSVAEKFGNTVFIMRTMKEAPKNRSDISPFPHYPYEQEVSLDRFLFYGIEKMELDSTSGKHTIYMQVVV